MPISSTFHFQLKGWVLKSIDANVETV